MKDYTCNRI